MNNHDKDVVRLLDRLYKDLYLSESVLHHGIGNKYDKFNNIKAYIDKLESVHRRISEIGRHINYLKQLYYDKYVIKRENIPDSYYEHQQKVALERGYGYFEVDAKQLQDQIIQNQKAKLDVWLDYFLSKDASVYPFWAKYWAFQGMLKLGKYDKEKGEFHRRTKNTIEPFADLNREALAMSIDVIEKMLNKEEINDNELEILVKTGSFQKIYSYILTKVLKDNGNIAKRNIGKWIKYNQGSDHMSLVKSLQGYNTGWCTAGEKTARTQLQKGDFYVYYTLDENNKYKVPRIAIRKEENKIAEIRGIAEEQNIESEMEEIVEEKIKDFPDNEEYYKKVGDMKKLTSIYKKYKNDEELTREELRFLYEIDDKIMGFGYKRDPRIDEIIYKRGDIKKDISFVLNCEKEQVALVMKEINKDTIYYKGNFNYVGNDTKNLILPKLISGNLDLKKLTSAQGLILQECIMGYLNLRSLKNTEGIRFPKKVVGYLDLRSLTAAKGLILPEIILGDLDLRSLENTEGITFPKKVDGYLDLSGLKSAKKLELPTEMKRYLDLSNLVSIDTLILPKNISGCIWIDKLQNVECLVLPEKIKDGVLNLYSLSNFESLIIPEPLTYIICMNGFYITPENVEQYRNNKKHI